MKKIFVCTDDDMEVKNTPEDIKEIKAWARSENIPIIEVHEYRITSNSKNIFNKYTKSISEKEETIGKIIFINGRELLNEHLKRKVEREFDIKFLMEKKDFPVKNSVQYIGIG